MEFRFKTNSDARIMTAVDIPYPVDISCILCNRATTDATRFNCCSCAATYHISCATHNSKYVIENGMNATSCYSIHNIKKWINAIYEKPNTMKLTVSKPSFAQIDTYIQDKISLRVGFINPRWPRRTFRDLLILWNSGFTDGYMVRCKNCGHNLEFYGNNSRFLSIDRFFDFINSACYIVPIAAMGLGISALSLITMAGVLSMNFGWFPDIMRDEPTDLNILTLLFVPHTFYSLVSSKVSFFSLLSSCVLFQFYMGIPIVGITSHIKKFLQYKILAKLIYHLTFNKYYYESFIDTPPALYGVKLRIEDAWDIQYYRNQYQEDDIAANTRLGIFGKIKKWFKTQYLLLNEDFKYLYELTSWDYFSQYGDTVFALTFGYLFRFLLLPENIYLTENQNIALSSLIGFGVYQSLYFIYSNYNACALARCYNNLNFTSNVRDNEANDMTNFIYRICGVLQFAH